MKASTIVFLVLFAVVTLGGSGCYTANTQQPGDEGSRFVQIPSSEFEDLLKDSSFKNWYETKYQVEGLHSFTRDNRRYVLLSAGEMPTGGYTIEEPQIVFTETQIEIRAKLSAPRGDEVVIQVLTYPHVLLSLPFDRRHLVFDGLAQEPEVHHYTGRFISQDIDTIQVRISGVPDEIEPRVFRLNAGIEARPRELGLETGDEIAFGYISGVDCDVIMYLDILE